MNLKKLAGWATILFIAWYIFHDPTAAGASVNHLLAHASSAATSAATFLGSINIG